MKNEEKKLYVIVSLDVEEEGLFSGKYPAVNPTVKNVGLLPKLAPLWHERRIPLTLFCSHAVFVNSDARKTIAFMRDNLQAEIGAHLHHWSTPPLQETPGVPCRTDKMPRELFARKLDALLQAATDFQGQPVKSFRMGRWDLKSCLLPLLAERGIEVDSSVCPLRSFRSGPDHFLAPAAPYWIAMPNSGRILEAPVTQIPISANLARLWYRLAAEKVDMLDSFHFFGAISANPFWHADIINRLAVKLHHARGNRILSVFWHSSEMMPGGSPHVPDEKTANQLLKRIFGFFEWLDSNFDVEGITIGQLPDSGLSFPSCGGPGDWQ